jgi:hypothetical protein
MRSNAKEKGGTHPNGALPTSIAELGSKAEVTAMIGEEAESRWSEIKIKTEETKSSVAKTSYDVFKSAQIRDSRAVGNVLLDGGQGERSLERRDGEQAREESDQSICREVNSKQVRTERSKEYTEARQQRN